MNPTDRIFLALDGMGINESCALVEKTSSLVYGYKVHDLADSQGIAHVADSFKAYGAKRTWIDYKVDDTPDTMAKRAAMIYARGARTLTVHATSGEKGMRAANGLQLAVYAVTVKTSMSIDECVEMFGRPPVEQVPILAKIAARAGVAGVVASAQEVGILSQMPELQGMEFIIPGTRSLGGDTHDQQRVDTARNAIKNGATRLVIGREVTQAPDPVGALKRILDMIA